MAKGGFRGGYPGGGNQMNMMRQAQKMQQDFLKMQQELETKEFEFTAGGGAVKATMIGTRQLHSIEISPDVVDSDDVEMLQDLILAAVNGAIKLADDETNKAMSKLQGGIWGFGVFDNGDAAKIDAAKTFIKYFADGEGTPDAVKAANYFAVRDTAEGIDLTGIWADNAIMNEYTKLMPYLGDYYQVTSGWATARTEWWNMLQRIGGGGDVATEVAEFCTNANAAAAG